MKLCFVWVQRHIYSFKDCDTWIECICVYILYDKKNPTILTFTGTTISYTHDYIIKFSISHI